MNKKIRSIILFLLIISIIPLTLGFTKTNKNPRTLYHIYLKGKSIGLIKSQKELEDYINKKQRKTKEKYHVDNVYIPDDVDIVKETTYGKKIMSVEKVYKKIKDISPFTIEGYIITIKE